MIRSECSRARKNVLAETGHSYRHSGELYEDVGKEISRRLHVPHFRIRARLIQLGYIEARGSLNYADRKLIQPFAFDCWVSTVSVRRRPALFFRDCPRMTSDLRYSLMMPHP